MIFLCFDLICFVVLCFQSQQTPLAIEVNCRKNRSVQREKWSSRIDKDTPVYKQAGVGNGFGGEQLNKPTRLGPGPSSRRPRQMRLRSLGNLIEQTGVVTQDYNQMVARRVPSLVGIVLH